MKSRIEVDILEVSQKMILSPGQHVIVLGGKIVGVYEPELAGSRLATAMPGPKTPPPISLNKLVGDMEKKVIKRGPHRTNEALAEKILARVVMAGSAGITTKKLCEKMKIKGGDPLRGTVSYMLHALIELGSVAAHPEDVDKRIPRYIAKA